MDDVLKNIETRETKTKKPEQEVNEVIVDGRDSFDYDLLKKHWNDFAALMKAEKESAAYGVLSQDIRLEENNRIVIKLSNPVEEDILKKFKPSLVKYLKEKLNNGSISIETEFGTVDTAKKIYTNKEKLDHLIHKKPILKDLKDRLGLDSDF